MIKGVIIVNNHGKPRLVKFYQSVVSTWWQAETPCLFLLQWGVYSYPYDSAYIDAT
jgi:hypothetical protein